VVVGNPSRASEFPNDNAEISGGAIWVHQDLIGPPRLEVRDPAPAAVADDSFTSVPNESFVLYFDDDEPYVDGPVELEADGATLSVAVFEPEPEPEQSSVVAELPTESPAFLHFESALVTALLAQGATRSAALVPQLLRLEALTADAVSKEVLLTLQSRGYLDGNARYSTKYRELCGAWTAVLRGSSEDFAACGTTTLDRFGADLLAALLPVPATRADELRRGLRKAGIAAFGVLAAA
jgi:hypothetical protein